MKEIGIGIIGCGDISNQYLDSLLNIFHLNVVAVTDMQHEKAEAAAKKYGIKRVCSSNEELLSIPQIDIVVVLTNPHSHFCVCESVLSAGKNAYVEKPLSLTREEGKRLLALAERNSRYICAAPDTVLGAGIQTARKLVDDGWIGKPIASTSHIINAGHEFWHPNPGFFYKEGAGPLFDVAPYYITALAYLIGPVASVMCSAKTTYKERTVTSEPRFGERIEVEVPTHLAGILNHRDGCISTILHSFDVSATKLSWDIEIYGTDGTITVPSPCMFGGEICYKKATWGKRKQPFDEKLLQKYGLSISPAQRQSGMMEIADMTLRNEGWASLPMLYCYTEDCRGLGVADLADALKTGRIPRLHGKLGYHTLDVMTGLLDSWKEGKRYDTDSTFDRTEPISTETVFGEI